MPNTGDSASIFEIKVASGLAEFCSDMTWAGWNLDRKSGLDERIEGSISIDGVHADGDGAHLRWFIVSEKLQGRHVGNRLIDIALNFCRDKHYRRIYLWTFQGLDSARHLYEKAGFKLVEEFSGTQWGPAVNEQKFDLQL